MVSVAVEVSSCCDPREALSACGEPLLGGVFLAGSFLSEPLDEEDAELFSSSSGVKTKGMWYSSMDIKDYEQALLGALVLS